MIQSLFFISTFFLCSFSFAQEPTGLNIQSTLIDKKGLPVEGVRIEAFIAGKATGIRDTTDATGYFELFNVSPAATSVKNSAILQNYAINPPVYLLQGGIRFDFALPVNKQIEFSVYTILGRRILHSTTHLLAGQHAWTWDGCDASGQRVARQMVFVRARLGGMHQSFKVFANGSTGVQSGFSAGTGAMLHAAFSNKNTNTAETITVEIRFGADTTVVAPGNATVSGAAGSTIADTITADRLARFVIAEARQIRVAPHGGKATFGFKLEDDEPLVAENILFQSEPGALLQSDSVSSFADYVFVDASGGDAEAEGTVQLSYRNPGSGFVSGPVAVQALVDTSYRTTRLQVVVADTSFDNGRVDYYAALVSHKPAYQYSYWNKFYAATPIGFVTENGSPRYFSIPVTDTTNADPYWGIHPDTLEVMSPDSSFIPVKIPLVNKGSKQSGELLIPVMNADVPYDAIADLFGGTNGRAYFPEGKLKTAFVNLVGVKRNGVPYNQIERVTEGIRLANKETAGCVELELPQERYNIFDYPIDVTDWNSEVAFSRGVGEGLYFPDFDAVVYIYNFDDASGENGAFEDPERPGYTRVIRAGISDGNNMPFTVTSEAIQAMSGRTRYSHLPDWNEPATAHGINGLGIDGVTSRVLYGKGNKVEWSMEELLFRIQHDAIGHNGWILIGERLIIRARYNLN
ncbi:MAG: carboxypeptidase regulatory-like domain-containing protein [Deferribacteres bacterium]|nr:carboxypeptidase regulatory-like domain-containing protein [Deferribacteres bacterium]